MNLLSRSRNFSIQEFLTSRKSFSIHESPYSGSFTRCLSKFFQKLDPPGPMRNRLKWFCWKICYRGDIRILSSKDFRFLDFSIFEGLSFFRTHVNSCTKLAPLRRKSQTISLSRDSSSFRLILKNIWEENKYQIGFHLNDLMLVLQSSLRVVVLFLRSSHLILVGFLISSQNVNIFFIWEVAIWYLLVLY